MVQQKGATPGGRGDMVGEIVRASSIAGPSLPSRPHAMKLGLNSTQLRPSQHSDEDEQSSQR